LFPVALRGVERCGHRLLAVSMVACGCQGVFVSYAACDV
jgi:hypothetical protein